MEYLEVFKVAVVPVLVALISSGMLTTLINKKSRHQADVDRIAAVCDKVIKNCDRQAEGLSVVMESMSMLLEVMHERGIVNGESEHVRQAINTYLMACAERGLYMSETKR